jgi:hypothetical protein
MKKVILTMLCAASMLGASATILWEGSCGYKIYTVDASWFETPEEAEEYYAELEDIFCGENGGEQTITDLKEGMN